MADSMGCEVCGRAIWVKDGPVCVFCRPPEVLPEVEIEEKPTKGKKTDG